MSATRNNSLMNIFVANLSKTVSENITNGEYICKSNMTRVYAITNATVIDKTIHDGEALALPEGYVEHFQTNSGQILVITGSVNISAIG